MSLLSKAEAEAILKRNFPPWIVELDLRFETLEKGRAVLRLPNNPRLAGAGGLLGGPALMAAADTAMAFAVASALPGFAAITTVTQTISLFRPVLDSDVLCEARLLRLGRALAFGEVLFRVLGGEAPVAQATASYALPPATSTR